MRNPFSKNNQKVVLAGIVIGTAAVSAAAYFLFSKTGSPVRERIAGRFGRIRAARQGVSADEQQQETPAYLQHRHKGPKTDREALVKHEILGEPDADNDRQEQH